MKSIVWTIQYIFKMLNQYGVKKFQRYQSTSFILTLSNSWRNAKPFFWNAERQRRAAKHLRHAWFFGERFCKSSCVIFSTLFAGIHGVPEEREPIHSSSGNVWKAKTRSRSERLVLTVSQKFNHPLRGRFLKEVWSRPTTSADRRSSFWQIPNTSYVWLLEDNIQTEVCTCSQFPTDAMLWITEVVMVDSVDDLMSSSSVSGIRMPDFEVLDAGITQALNRIFNNSHSKRRSSLEEQKAQKQERFLRGRQIACLIYECLGSQELTILSRIMPTYWHSFFEMMIFRNSIRRRDGILFTMTKIPRDIILQRLYKLRIRGSEKLKTVLELYDLEIHQKQTGRDSRIFKTMVKRSIEQDSRNWNFGVRNENYERNAEVKNPGTKTACTKKSWRLLAMRV